MPALIDGVDDAVGVAYGGWPDRLYVIGKDGRVVYAGERGPGGFDVVGWEQAIVKEKAKVAAEREKQREKVGETQGKGAAQGGASTG